MKKQLMLLTVIALGASVAQVEAGFRSSVKDLASKALDKTKALASTTKRGIEAALASEPAQQLEAKVVALAKEYAKKGLDQAQEYALTYGKSLLKKVSKSLYDAAKTKIAKETGFNLDVIGETVAAAKK